MLIEVDPHRDPDQHQKIRGSLFAHAYDVRSTSVNGLVSYSAHRQTDRQTDRRTDRQTDKRYDSIIPPWQSSKTKQITRSNR